MAKQKTRKKTYKVKASAKHEGFEISINCEVTNHGGLASFEVNDVIRKLKHNLAKGISALPFSEIYPHEVKVK